jgi:hypothetical protein
VGDDAIDDLFRKARISTPVFLVPEERPNLGLLVGNPELFRKLLRVDSNTMQTHSPFFEAILNGPLLESCANEPIAFLMTIRVPFSGFVRSCTDKVPGTSPWCRGLVSLVALVDKYDFHEATRMQLKEWADAKIANRVISEMRVDQICYIGWTLGYRSMFEIRWYRLID